jgi:hypothetical protein
MRIPTGPSLYSPSQLHYTLCLAFRGRRLLLDKDQHVPRFEWCTAGFRVADCLTLGAVPVSPGGSATQNACPIRAVSWV